MADSYFDPAAFVANEQAKTQQAAQAAQAATGQVQPGAQPLNTAIAGSTQNQTGNTGSPLDSAISGSTGIGEPANVGAGPMDVGSTQALLNTTHAQAQPRNADIPNAQPGQAQGTAIPGYTGAAPQFANLTGPAEENQIIKWESGGNVNSVNNWDANAKAGNASTGIGQLTGTNRDEYGKLAGLQPSQYRDNNYTDQLAEMRAYISQRYGNGGRDSYDQALNNAYAFHVAHGWY